METDVQRYHGRWVCHDGPDGRSYLQTDHYLVSVCIVSHSGVLFVDRLRLDPFKRAYLVSSRIPVCRV